MPRITSKGQVTIPKGIRKKMGLEPGDEIVFEIAESGCVIKKRIIGSVFDKYVGYLSKHKGKEVDDIITDLRGH